MNTSEVEKAFREHKGRPGKVGGSLPRGASAPVMRNRGTIAITTDAKELLRHTRISARDVAELSGMGAGDSAEIQTDDEFDNSDELIVKIKGRDYSATRTLYIRGGRVREIHNELLFVDINGAGIGTKVFYRQVLKARAMGVHSINAACEREGDMNGYYTWARLGYNGEIETTLKELPDKWAGARTVHELFQLGGEDAMKWWKAYGDDFDGTFDTRLNSLSSQILEAYVRKKNAKVR